MKLADGDALGHAIMSHPTRVRGLKREIGEVKAGISGSHPTRVRGLKLAVHTR